MKNAQIRALRQGAHSQQQYQGVNGRLLKWKATVLTTAFTGYHKEVKQIGTSVAVLKIRVVTKTDVKMR